MPFAIPRTWREPTNHLNDCYFCMVDVSHYRKSKDKRSIVYPSIPSSIAPVPHCLPIPEPPTLELPSCASTSSEEDTDADFCEASTSEEPHFPNQHEMDDLIRDMGLTNESAQLLTSRLKEWNLLDPTCKVSKYRKRHLSFARFFTVSQPHSLCYCSTYLKFFNEIGIDYNPTDWRLFIDSSVKSLKAVLLHSGEFPSISVSHSVHMKKEYENVKTLLNMIKYNNTFSSILTCPKHLPYKVPSFSYLLSTLLSISSWAYLSLHHHLPAVSQFSLSNTTHLSSQHDQTTSTCFIA